MSIDEFIAELSTIQNRLISMPEEEALGDSFAHEQSKLTQLLDSLDRYPKEDQDRAKAKMREFAEQLNAKLASLKEKMKDLSQDINFQHNLQKGMKAYGQERKLF